MSELRIVASIAISLGVFLTGYIIYQCLRLVHYSILAVRAVIWHLEWYRDRAEDEGLFKQRIPPRHRSSPPPDSHPGYSDSQPMQQPREPWQPPPQQQPQDQRQYPQEYYPPGYTQQYSVHDQGPRRP